MGVFQKVNDWLADRSERFIHGRETNQFSGGAYYASSEAEQAYGGMNPAVQENAAEAAAVNDRSEAADPYGGRVPYRSQRDMQAEAEMQRRQAEDQARRQQQAAEQQRQASFAQPQAAPAFGSQQYPQQQQATGNILQFPGMVRGPEGNLYAHVEYVVLLRNRNECTRVIEYIKSNASVFLNMEFIASDGERQRCVDMLSGAAYTLGCRLNKISQRGIYLISSPSVYVVLDPAMQKYAASREAQGYRSAEYAGYQPYAGAPAYAAQQNPGYVGYAAAGYADQWSANYGQNAGVRSDGYQAQHGAPFVNPGYGAETGAYAAQPETDFPAERHNAGFAAQPNGYPAQPNAGYDARENADYAARHNAGFRQNASFGAQGSREAFGM